VGEYSTFYWSLYSKKYQIVPEWNKKFNKIVANINYVVNGQLLHKSLRQYTHTHNSFKLWTKKQTYLWDLIFSLYFHTTSVMITELPLNWEGISLHFPFTLQNNKMNYVMQIIFVSWLVNIKYYRNYDIKSQSLIGSARNLNATMNINAVSGVCVFFVIIQQTVTW